MRSLPITLYCLTIFVFLAAFAPVRAANAQQASVEFVWESRETTVRAAVALSINVHDTDDIGEPVLPDVEGVMFRIQPGRNTMEETSIINGKAEHRRTTRITVNVTPLKSGKISIPPITISAGGKPFKSDPTTLIVHDAEVTDTANALYVDVIADPASPMVGQPTTMTLRIWVRPYRSVEQNVKLDEGSMWQLIDLEHSKFGRFKQALEELGRRGRRPVGQPQLKDDREYFVYSIPATYRASRPGAPELGDIEIQLNMPTGVRVARDLFGRKSVQASGVQPMSAAPSLVDANIRPLPSEGQPAFFNGAVGRFGVSASAKPTQVSVGDPITVTYTITSQSEDDAAALEELQAPPFASIPELSKYFRIPSDPIAGKVTDRRKVFTQTFRPITDAASEIPSIPFAFFDPQTGKYSVVESKAIPITVSAAERLNLSQIVGGSANAVERPEKSLTAVAGGLLANVPPSTALLADQRPPLGLALAIAAGVPPIACAALAFAVAAKRRRDADPLRRRSAKASRIALHSLTAKATPQVVLAALTGFVADRCGLSDGERTRGDAIAALRDRGVDDELVARLDRLLALCERSRFAPKGDDAVSVDEARELVRRVDRLSLALKGGGR